METIQKAAVTVESVKAKIKGLKLQDIKADVSEKENAIVTKLHFTGRILQIEIKKLMDIGTIDMLRSGAGITVNIFTKK